MLHQSYEYLRVFINGSESMNGHSICLLYSTCKYVLCVCARSISTRKRKKNYGVKFECYICDYHAFFIHFQYYYSYYIIYCYYYQISLCFDRLFNEFYHFLVKIFQLCHWNLKKPHIWITVIVMVILPIYFSMKVLNDVTRNG